MPFIWFAWQPLKCGQSELNLWRTLCRDGANESSNLFISNGYCYDLRIEEINFCMHSIMTLRCTWQRKTALLSTPSSGFNICYLRSLQYSMKFHHTLIWSQISQAKMVWTFCLRVDQNMESSEPGRHLLCMEFDNAVTLS